MSDRRLPPQSVEAEMSVLGAVFLDHHCLPNVRRMCAGSDFYRQPHRLIFDAFCDLYDTGRPIELVSTAELLKSRGQLEEAGGGAYLATLVDYVPTSTNVGYYCGIVKEKANLRRCITVLGDLSSRAYGDDVDLRTLLADVREAGVSLSEMNKTGGILADLLTLDQRAQRYQDYVRELDTRRFLTNLELLDDEIRGVAPGEVLTILAYSGTYKSALLQWMLSRGAWRSKHHHIFFSLEMPVEKVFEREGQMYGEVSGREVESRFRSQNEHDLFHSMKSRGGDRVLVCEKSKLGLREISEYVETARLRYGEIGAIGIDYLGLLAAVGGKSDYERISSVVRDVKNLAKSCRVPVLLLSQVNRNYSEDANREIGMDAGKGSGDIEAAADFLVGLWRDGNSLNLKLMKNRNGMKGQRWQVMIDSRTLNFDGLVRLADSPKRQKNTEAPDF